MNSKNKNGIGADDSNGRVLRTPEAAALALKGIRPIAFSPSVCVAYTRRRQNYGTGFNPCFERKSTLVPLAI
ncbi:MAG: hypothetical protein WA849_09620, partial [Candidatus Udaeobacter sp.]